MLINLIMAQALTAWGCFNVHLIYLKDPELEQQSCKQLTKTFGSEHPAIVTIINRCVFAHQFAISIPVQGNYEPLQLLLYLVSNHGAL